MRTDWGARAASAIDERELVAILVDLVRIPSVGGSAGEVEIQHRLAVDLGRLGAETDLWRIDLDDVLSRPDFPGVEVARDEAWGLVARFPGTGDGPPLMLNAHVDVVPPGDLAAWSQSDPYGASVTADRVLGRGACDMKGGLVAALIAIRALREVGAPLRGDVLLACVPGEEDGGLGTYALLDRGWRADACVVPEPTGLDLVPANAGALTFRLRVRGRATHASRRTEGVSAVDKFWPVWRALERLEQERNVAVDPLMRRWPLAYPISIGTVTCGDWASTVPDLLVAEGRLGVALDEPVEEARQALSEAVAEACAADSWLREHPVEVEWWGGQFAPGRLPAWSDLLARVRRAHAAVADQEPDVWGAPYGSDLRLLTGLGGIPTLHYGPGDAALAHAPDEAVPIAEVVTAARTLALLALDVCGVA
ncbi:MAG: ArgE/DapE family deacylase [Actinomycetota bacterium]|nr:ArgE/DapE family deacylase [Actinomycetota bacterium]